MQTFKELVMSSKWARKLDYFRERAANAIWMIKKGDFKLILESIALEIHYRMEDVREWIRLARLLDDSQVEGSSYINRRSVIPPSSCPTVRVMPGSLRPAADKNAVASELETIVSSLEVRDRHSL